MPRMTTVLPRAITSWVVAPALRPGAQTIGFSETANADLIWLLLSQLMLSPEKGRALFPKPLKNQNKLWIEFRNYVRSAKTYWDSAVTINGSSAALLYYYAFLNLAKAELLTTVPSSVVGTKLMHGLSFDPSKAKSLKSDRLKVHGGAFSLLYEKRLGSPLTEPTLEVRRLLPARSRSRSRTR